MVGKEQPIRQCATAMIVGGHILLEDNPGTGKTQLARGLANSIDMSFKRIQFTPDLLPSDVVGVTYYDQKNGEFEYREGPIFASIVLADEINRASPKTQSALLEVMEEQKVTVDGEAHAVPQPFMVIATQNPIEQLGTYKLPEAQMDRFLIKTTIGYPSHDVSVNILKQVNVTDRASTVHAVLTGNDVLRMRAISETVRLDDAILEYIVRLAEATRHNERIQVGSSMRGALALTRCARVWAASSNRGYVVPDDVKQLAVAVLAHRITLTAEATFAGSTPELMIEQILAMTCPHRPWAPPPEAHGAANRCTDTRITTEAHTLHETFVNPRKAMHATIQNHAAQENHATIPASHQASHQTTGHLIRVAARMGRDRTRHRLTHSVHDPRLA